MYIDLEASLPLSVWVCSVRGCVPNFYYFGWRWFHVLHHGLRYTVGEDAGEYIAREWRCYHRVCISQALMCLVDFLPPSKHENEDRVHSWRSVSGTFITLTLTFLSYPLFSLSMSSLLADSHDSGSSPLSIIIITNQIDRSFQSKFRHKTHHCNNLASREIVRRTWKCLEKNFWMC